MIRLIDVEATLCTLDALIFARTGKHLNTLQTAIIRGAWLGQKYEDIAEACHCSDAHIKALGAELWELLSKALEEPVNKKNFRAALERRGDLSASKNGATISSSLTPQYFPNPTSVASELEFPEGQVKLGSRFYVDRPPIETRCKQAILQPGVLIRIKAPRQMGKTSLLARILYQAQQHGYRTVSLNLQLVDGKTFQDLDRFLQWFCARVTRGLELPLRLADYWDEIFGSKTSCKDYFESYLLPQLQQPLVLALDEVDSVFQYPEIADHFFALLRAWHEEAKNSDLWQNLRLVLVHSTEVYIPFRINQSPFNVGLPIELPEFNAQQVRLLAHCHGLDWKAAQVEQLMSLVGGHPYLVRMALCHIVSHQMSLNEFLHLAPTEVGPYNHHLRRHLLTLEEQPNLTTVLKTLLAKTALPHLASLEIFQLNRMGLIQLQNKQAMLRCELYSQYFSDRLA